MANYLTSDHLWKHVENRTRSAHASGSLHSIPTRLIEIAESGFVFQIRIVDQLADASGAVRERVSQKPLPADTNPFLPYDENLYVGELNASYRCLLNKFNVIDGHILLVTNTFTEQLAPMKPVDFEAALIALRAKPGLVFYNGGQKAGASVRHRHLQMIPSRSDPGSNFPMEALFEATSGPSGDPNKLFQCAALPFPHRIAKSIFSPLDNDLSSQAGANFDLYVSMLKALDLESSSGQLAPSHNMLITREYLWVVPRSKESHAGIPVNALGFSGALLLINNRQLEIINRIGVLGILQAVVI